MSDVGELNHSITPPRHGIGQLYDPEYEWPGESIEESLPDYSLAEDLPCSSRKSQGKQPCFRFVVDKTSILPSKHKIAVADGFSEVQFGRDVAPKGAATPRIRLKEMEVSKLHATAYWDGARKEWAIVDMGSKHGTYLYSGQSPTKIALRLSPTRTASVPKQLRHLDMLKIGSTTFVIHIHSNRRPCDDCSPSKGEEIPLSVIREPMNPRLKRVRELSSPNDSEQEDRNTRKNAKRALNMLKQSLLMQHHSGGGAPLSEFPYTDRAARRRSLAYRFDLDAPGLPARSRPETLTAVDPLPSAGQLIRPFMSQPSIPISGTNVGHRLLIKQGWTPGTTLGQLIEPSDERIALLEPLAVGRTAHRAGLGVKKG